MQRKAILSKKIQMNQSLYEFEYDSKKRINGVSVSKDALMQEFPILKDSLIKDIEVNDGEYTHGIYHFNVIYKDDTELSFNFYVSDLNKISGLSSEDNEYLLNKLGVN